jgi:hypothetical protein
VREEDHTVKAKREEKETVREEDALNPSPKAPVKFHFKIDGRHEKVLNRTDIHGNVTWPHERAGIHFMGSYTSSRQT